MNEYERAQKIIAALRAELDAERAKSAALEARDKEARDALEAVHTLLDSAAIGREHVAYRVNSLINQRDEARELVRRSSGMRSRSLEAIIARWDAERAAPVTNRDTGDESRV